MSLQFGIFLWNFSKVLFGEINRVESIVCKKKQINANNSEYKFS